MALQPVDVVAAADRRHWVPMGRFLRLLSALVTVSMVPLCKL